MVSYLQPETSSCLFWFTFPCFFFTAQVEAVIATDMSAQQRWVEIIRPMAALLKFRLPWDDGATDYLSGTVALPVWGPPTTTESRLIVPSPLLVHAAKNQGEYVTVPPGGTDAHSTDRRTVAGSATVEEPSTLEHSQSQVFSLISTALEAEISYIQQRQKEKRQVLDAACLPAIAHSTAYAKNRWNNQVYSDQLFHFNTDTRLRAYFHDCSDAQEKLRSLSLSSPRSPPRHVSLSRKRLRPNDGSNSRYFKAGFNSVFVEEEPEIPDACKGIGIDHCFDCSAEVAVLRAFLLQVWPRINHSSAELASTIRSMSTSISSAISPHTGRLLTTVLPQAALRFPCHVSFFLLY